MAQRPQSSSRRPAGKSSAAGHSAPPQPKGQGKPRTARSGGKKPASSAGQHPAGGSAQKPKGQKAKQPGSRSTSARSPAHSKGAARTPAARPAAPAPKPQSRPTAAAYQRRVTRGEMRRRQLHRKLATLAGVLVLVFLGIGLSISVLFKVNHYQVENLDQTTPAETGIYTEQQILDALGVAEGENLFGFSLKEKEHQMAQELPYLESIQLRRRLPSTLVVRVAPAAAKFKFPCEEGWAIVSTSLKILDVLEEEPAQFVSVTGAEAIEPRVGKALVVDTRDEPEASSPEAASGSQPPRSDTPNRDAFAALMQGLQDAQLLEGLTDIDLSNLKQVSFVQGQRVRVLLGSLNQLDYKLRLASHILANEQGDGLAADERGRLDVSHVLADGSIRSLFTPGDPYAEPQPAEPEAAEPPAEPAAAAAVPAE